MSVYLRFLRVLLLGALASLRPGVPARVGGQRPAPAYVVVDLGVLPGGDTSVAAGINDRGQVVGFAYAGTLEGPLRVRAFLYAAAATPQMRDLNALIPTGSSVVLEEADGINDAGQIAATGTIHGHEHAFRLTPVGLARPMATPTR